MRNYRSWTGFLCVKNTHDIDEIYSCWYSHFRSLIEKYIPLEMVTIRPNDKPWMDSKVRLAMRRRERVLRIHNFRPSPVTWESYRVQRNIVKPPSDDLLKNHSMKVLIRISVIQIYTVRSGGQSLIG